MGPASSNKTIEIGIVAIQFALAECLRIHALMKGLKPNEFLQQMTKADLLGSLPMSTGREVTCGSDATQRLHRLAIIALRHSDAAGTVEADKVYAPLRRLVGHRFLEEQKPVDAAHVDEVISAALEEAKRSRANCTHFVPCRLMFTKNPAAFHVGPVKFQTTASFNEAMKTHFAAYVEPASTPLERQTSEKLLSQARLYYDAFGWVGEVHILNCDPPTSKKRAFLAITAALDMLHLMFGAYHTERMVVAGPRMPDDRRAHMSLADDGSFDISCSSSSTSAVGFQDGWDKFLERADFATLLNIAAKAIEPLVDPSVQRPLGLRMVDAAAWFGDAVREQSDAARIVKASNALEHILTTGREKRLTKTLTERAAAVCFDLDSEESFEELVQQFSEFYDLRSALVHGRISPFDPEVEERCAISLRLVEDALCATFGFYASGGALDRPVTNKQLAVGYERLIEEVKEVDKSRRAQPA